MQFNTRSAIAGIVSIALFVLAIYYFYFRVEPRGGFGLRLIQIYSFNQLVNLTIEKIGFSGIILVATGFVALATLYTSLPSSGGFAGLDSRVAGLFLLGQAVVWLFFLFLVAGLRELPSLLISTAPYYAPLVIAALWTMPLVINGLSFSDFEKNPSTPITPATTFFNRKFLPSTLLLTVIVGDLFYYAVYDPNLTLLAWAFLVYVTAFGFLSFAYCQGLAYQLTNAKYVRIFPTEGDTTDGYLVSKGTDHYIIMTLERTFLLQSSSVREIEVLNKGKANEEFDEI